MPVQHGEENAPGGCGVAGGVGEDLFRAVNGGSGLGKVGGAMFDHLMAWFRPGFEVELQGEAAAHDKRLVRAVGRGRKQPRTGRKSKGVTVPVEHGDGFRQGGLRAKSGIGEFDRHPADFFHRVGMNPTAVGMCQ